MSPKLNFNKSDLQNTMLDNNESKHIPNNNPNGSQPENYFQEVPVTETTILGDAMNKFIIYNDEIRNLLLKIEHSLNLIYSDDISTSKAIKPDYKDGCLYPRIPTIDFISTIKNELNVLASISVRLNAIKTTLEHII